LYNFKGAAPLKFVKPKMSKFWCDLEQLSNLTSIISKTYKDVDKR